MKRQFAAGAAWMTASSWVEQAVSAITFIVVARLIGVEEFGVTAMAFALLFLGEFLVRDTITEAIVERISIEEGRLEATFVGLLVLSCLIALALVAASVAAAWVYDEPRVAPLLTAATPVVLMIGAAGVPTALLRRQLAYRALAVRSMAGVVAGGVVGVSMAANDLGAWSLVGQRLAEIGTNSILAFTTSGWRPRRWPTLAEYRLLGGLGPRVVVLRSTSLVITQTPTVALGITAEPTAVGQFAFAWRLVELVCFLMVKPIQGVAQSALAAARRMQTPTAQLYLDITELTALGAFTAFAGLALIGEPLIGVLFGADWRPASDFLPVLCIAGACSALTAMQEAYLLALARVQAFVNAAFVEVAIGVVLVAVASAHGPALVAVAVAVRAATALILRTLAALAPEAIAVSRLAKTLAPPVAITLATCAAVAAWRAAMLDRLPDPTFVATAIVFGMGAAALILFGFMPGTVARLRTFIRPEA